MASSFKYLPYIVHPAIDRVNLVSMEFIPNISRRGKTQTVLKRMTIEGTICATNDSSPTLTERIEAIRDAYDQDYGDFGLYINGVLTSHALFTTHPDNLTGVRVVARSWPKGEPSEYATTRYFRVTLAAMFLPPNVDQTIAFRETVRFVGSSGPIRRFSRRKVGPWPIEQLYSNSTQMIYQQGEIWGLQGYPLGVLPAPLLASGPGVIQHVDQNDIQEIGGVWVGRTFLEYGLRYTYPMESNTQTAGAISPNLY